VPSAGTWELRITISYGTIYTTKLLRRGTDINRAAPWRAVADLKVTDVMRPFQPALPLPPGATAAETADRGGAAGDLDRKALAGPVTYRHDVRALFASAGTGCPWYGTPANWRAG
jgi:chloride channel protein, CIC family